MEEVIEALQSLFIHPDRLAVSSHEVIGKSQFEVRAAVLDKKHNVAVKLIPFSSLAGDERLLVSLKKEVLAMKECESEFVVHLMGVCLWEREMGVVMERMSGSLSVYAYGVKRLALSYEQVVRVALKMAQGLELLHAKGFVHRDVKPENILVNSDASVVKWTDFGLASALLTSVVATKTNVGAGTPHFMSPEQTDSDGVVTRAADVWSFGCLILSLLKGDTPWPADWKPMQLAVAMLMKKQTPTVPDTIPAEMQTLLRRCLTWEYADRPTASQVVSLLREMAQPVPGPMPQQSASQVNVSLPVAKAQVSRPAESSTVHASADVHFIAQAVEGSSGAELYDQAQNHIYARHPFKKDIRKGAELLKQAAEMGHPRAMFEWGMSLYEGLYFAKKDVKGGESFVLKAAEAGDQLAGAYCHLEGWGSSKKDHLRHFTLLQPLNTSDSWVMYFLGLAYLEGRGVVKNYLTACEWLQRAASAGHILGQCLLGEDRLGGYGDKRRGVELYKLAADQGHIKALYRVGQLYEEGEHVDRNLKKAIECYTLAHAQGFPFAKAALRRLGITI